MSTRRVFWALVRNDARLGSTIRLEKNKSKVYELSLKLTAIGMVLVVGGLLLGLGMHSSHLFAERVITILDYLITPSPFTICFFFYIPFAFTLEMVPREWKNGTVGWWLTLPYSRKLLIGAKSIAGFFRFMKLLLILFITCEYVTLLIIYLNPEVGNFALLEYLPQKIIYSCAVTLLLSPFFVSLGSTLGVLSRGRIKGVPVFFPGLFVAIIVSIFLSSPLNAVFSADAYRSPAWLSLLLVFGVSLGLGALLFVLAVYVLEHKIDV